MKNSIKKIIIDDLIPKGLNMYEIHDEVNEKHDANADIEEVHDFLMEYLFQND